MNVRTWRQLAGITLGLLVSTVLHAQVATVSVTWNPTTPSAGEMVVVSASAYEFDVNLANISWSVDGKVKESGVGKKSLSLTMPAGGKALTVSVKVTPQGGAAIEKTVSISSSQIDMMWESIDGYAPPFYRGKTLPISQGQVKVVAVPSATAANGSLISGKTYSYNWTQDGQNYPGQSGFGKSSYVFGNRLLEKTNQVAVNASNGTNRASSAIVIAYATPKIMLYENDARSGVTLYQTALGGNIATKQTKLNIVAEPFFLPKDFLANADTVMKWTLNNQEVKGVTKNNLVINTSTTTGNVSLGFSYNETKKLFRSFNSSLNINVSH